MIRLRTSRPSWLSMTLPLLTVTDRHGIDAAAWCPHIDSPFTVCEPKREFAECIGHAGSANHAVVAIGGGHGDLNQGLASFALDAAHQARCAAREGSTVRHTCWGEASHGDSCRHCRRERASDRARSGHCRSARPAARASGWPERARRLRALRRVPRCGRWWLSRVLLPLGRRDVGRTVGALGVCRGPGVVLHGTAQRRQVRAAPRSRRWPARLAVHFAPPLSDQSSWEPHSLVRSPNKSGKERWWTAYSKRPGRNPNSAGSRTTTPRPWAYNRTPSVRKCGSVRRVNRGPVDRWCIELGGTMWPDTTSRKRWARSTLSARSSSRNWRVPAFQPNEGGRRARGERSNPWSNTT